MAKKSDKVETVQETVVGEFTIKSGTIPNDLGQRGRQPKYPFAKMTHGTYFDIEVDKQGTAALKNSIQKFQQLHEGVKLRTQKLSEREVNNAKLTNYRVWCVEHPEAKKAA